MAKSDPGVPNARSRLGLSPHVPTRGGVVPLLLRAAIFGTGMLAWQTVAANRPQGPFAPVMVLLVFTAAAMPGGPVPMVLLVAIGAWQTAVGGVDLRLPFTIACTHAHHVLCALAAGLPLGSHVERATFRRPLVRFVMVQAGVLALLCGLIAVRTLGRSAPGAVLLATTGVVVGVTATWLSRYLLNAR